MSFNKILDKLLESIKYELSKEETITKIKLDIIKPLLKVVLEELSGYLFIFGIIVIIIMICLFCILFTNIKICYK